MIKSVLPGVETLRQAGEPTRRDLGGRKAGSAGECPCRWIGAEEVTLPLVLVVDDNPENLTVIGELLQPAHSVRAANGGARALKLAALAPQPDLILLDVMMPEMDGYEVLQRLRAEPQTADIPVVFLTALNSSADEERGLLLGAADYITKPIRPPILLARVRAQLELKQAREGQRNRSRWLELEASRRAGETQQLQAAGVHALAALAAAADSANAYHLRRTQACVAVLVRQLQSPLSALGTQLGEAGAALLVQCAVLHDVGGLLVPAAVWDKPGPLDADEQRLMRQHTLRADAALAQADLDAQGGGAWLQMARQIVRSHHERWDGGGYPDGLVGPDIPLPARVVALADAFEAMRSPRRHRDALSPAQARARILAERGLQFDPQLVDAFEACFDDLLACLDAVPPVLDTGATA
ncbi:MAG: two-component system response regulator [Burkholderiales bacterium PBB5]|nr:MAG: two-component system response regulator [Burkholderiales bacterium PBB5]